MVSHSFFLVQLVALFLFLSQACYAQDVDCFAARDAGNSCSENQSSRMFYYLPRLGTCQPFMYEGCGGNSNRFASAQECRNACANAQAQKDSVSTDETVQMKINQPLIVLQPPMQRFVEIWRPVPELLHFTY
uniref:BPTI/Kunitz inhibitor domain-containing protein n=1 Tax=Caenorhabditis japonica TaxID=281687 RepID=A0A8R1I6U6_CAEJA